MNIDYTVTALMFPAIPLISKNIPKPNAEAYLNMPLKNTNEIIHKSKNT